MPYTRARLFVPFCLTAILMLFPGCGGGGPSDTPDLGRVTGVVTMDAQPLEGAMVIFEPTDAAASMGLTDAEGKFVLAYPNGEQGASIGTHTVRITVPSPGDAPDPSYRDPVPPSYNIRSEMTKDVEAGDNEFTFELSSQS